MSTCICEDESVVRDTPIQCANPGCHVKFQPKLTRHERMLQCTAHDEQDRFRPGGGMSYGSPLCDVCVDQGYYFTVHYSGIREIGLKKK